MKIFVSSADENSIKSKDNKEMVAYLKRLGHNIVEDKDNPKSSGYQKKLEQLIKNSDIVILNLGNDGIKTGYLVASALSEKKVIITLERKDLQIEQNPFIHDHKAKSIINKKYDDDIIEVLEEGLEEAKSKLDTKFILIISPEIDRYLDWAAQNKRMHKAQIVRNSIENTIKKDREYKNFLEGK